jgi:hypothetical protein
MAQMLQRDWPGLVSLGLGEGERERERRGVVQWRGGLWILGLVGLDLFSPFPPDHLSPRARSASPLSYKIFPPHFCFPFGFLFFV